MRFIALILALQILGQSNLAKWILNWDGQR